jgi:hypothetical protein
MKKGVLITLTIICIVAIVISLPVLAPHILAKLRQAHHLLEGNIPSPLAPIITANQSSIQVGPLISHNVPAFSSSAAYPASNADDSSYDTTWRSQGAPAWLAYDLSSVPATKRSTILLVWYNDDTGLYDHTLIGYPAYNLPKDYTIEVNAAPGGGQAPKTGWVVKATVKNNHFHSRQHVIDMEGYNWIRMNITAIDGSVENEDASLNLDIFDARTALSDDWIFYGDSITAGAMGHQTLNGVLSFSQLINAKVPNSYPVQEAGGTGYLTSADGAKDLATWLALFPGKYVGLSYGTNDALGCVNPDTFYSNYVAMIQDVLRAGKVPLVPRIPWGKDANIQRCGPALNAQIEKLYSTFPQIIHGPDFWGFFQNQQNLISNDTIHPTDAGFAAYRQQWANTMLAEIYKR